MALSLRRWRPRHLLLAWSGYWLALLLVVLGRPALAAWRMSRHPDAHGNVSASFDGGLVDASIVVDGATAWSGSASLVSITLWLVGPPLLLWLLWLVRSRASETDAWRTGDAAAVPPSAAPHALHAPMPAELDRLRDRPAAQPAERGFPGT